MMASLQMVSHAIWVRRRQLIVLRPLYAQDSMGTLRTALREKGALGVVADMRMRLSTLVGAARLRRRAAATVLGNNVSPWCSLIAVSCPCNVIQPSDAIGTGVKRRFDAEHTI